ncbi:M23 family metallopeptidase [Kocuria rhizophila]|uniref:M23 family metallopeptidase n=2 Tax=Kocuria rhizophila TaxID=72000 RepID=UPI001D5288F0|nr:M23 family metallopeptidase [Kocuria rhizophila]MCC5672620.1 M23 family metallopeptidase [Kocuria rhizophila]MCC5674740.1 M23 family metallopeptidase [Kocuria rhizophila]
MARSRARSSATRGPSMALVAFTSFSLLVAGGVALSNGTEVAPWQPAMAHDANGPQRAGAPARAQDDAAARPAELSLFASRPDRAAIDSARDASLVALSSTAPSAGGGHGGNGRGGPRRATVPPVTTAEHAPPVFDGKLPVNTLIAPAQPVIVLKGGEFGWRTAPDTGQHELHNGTDISAPEGTPVVAALDGTVTAVFWDVWGGNRVEVSHANGMKTTYNHLSRIMVREGDTLKASEQLGEVGHTGTRVTGPHLHFETWVGGEVVDAQSFDWKTGKDIIRASRPAYSTADQTGVSQAPTNPNAKPGTDAGTGPKAPAKGQDEIRALDQKTAPAKDTSASGNGKASGESAPKASDSFGKKQKTQGPSAPPQRDGGKTKPGSGKTTAPAPAPSATSSKIPPKGTGTPGNSGTTDPTPTPSRTMTPTPKPTTSTPPQPSPPPTTPAPSPVNPYTAPIEQLTTLEQFQQRTQNLLATQLKLTPAEQFGPLTPLNVELKALTQQLTVRNLAAVNPAYAKQLRITQQAVEKASAKPAPSKLTSAATAELTKLQDLVKNAPLYKDKNAAAPGAGQPAPAVPGPAAPQN